jgi:predicted HicB family RNase H-like nuclease
MTEEKKHHGEATTADVDTAKPHRIRRGRPSRLTNNRANFGLRVDVALLNDLRTLADNAQMVSLNAYITAVLDWHVLNLKKKEAK